MIYERLEHISTCTCSTRAGNRDAIERQYIYNHVLFYCSDLGLTFVYCFFSFLWSLIKPASPINTDKQDIAKV